MFELVPQERFQEPVVRQSVFVGPEGISERIDEQIVDGRVPQDVSSPHATEEWMADMPVPRIMKAKDTF